MRFTFLKLSIAGAAFAFTVLAGAAAASEFPVYVAYSFPVTAHQLSVTAPANAEQQAPVPTLTRADMPASPHQLAVLTPHRKRVSEGPGSGPARY